MVLKEIRTALIALGLFTLLTGLIYPLVITGVGQLVFPAQANGSLITRNEKIIGSELIGQSFRDPGHFWGRLSATGPFPFNAGASSGSNFGPLNPALFDAVGSRIRDLKAADSDNASRVPVDLVTSSGSGLDPHISPAAALYQVPRVARARRMTEERLKARVTQCTEGRDLGILGEPGVNVLRLNLALEDLSQRGGER